MFFIPPTNYVVYKFEIIVTKSSDYLTWHPLFDSRHKNELGM